MSEDQTDDDDPEKRVYKSRDESVDIRASLPDNAYQVLYTPRVITSEEEIDDERLEEDVDEKLTQFTNNQINTRASRPHLMLFVTEGKTNVASGSRIEFLHQNLDGTKSVRKSSEFTHVPLIMFAHPTAAMEDDETFPSPSRKPSSNPMKKVRWPVRSDSILIKKSMSVAGMSHQSPHVPPHVRVHVTQRLLTIRDTLVEIVVSLKSNDFGGPNFKWNPKSLASYGITIPQNFRIPKAFKSFAHLTL